MLPTRLGLLPIRLYPAETVEDQPGGRDGAADNNALSAVVLVAEDHQGQIAGGPGLQVGRDGAVSGGDQSAAAQRNGVAAAGDRAVGPQRPYVDVAAQDRAFPSGRSHCRPRRCWAWPRTEASRSRLWRYNSGRRPCRSDRRPRYTARPSSRRRGCCPPGPFR